MGGQGLGYYRDVPPANWVEAEEDAARAVVEAKRAAALAASQPRRSGLSAMAAAEMGSGTTLSPLTSLLVH